MPATKTRRPAAPKARRDLEQEITDKILALLEEGTAPWRIPWSDHGAPRNLVSGKPYRGVNVFITTMTALAAGYSDPRWLTFKQCAERGGNLKGQQGTTVVFWKVVTEDRNKVKLDTPYRVLRHYTVFNVEQADGLDLEPLPTANLDVHAKCVRADEIIQQMPDRPRIQRHGARAYYSPAEDLVNVPSKVSFKTLSGYYSTMFHELAHSTGHARRLNREGFDAQTFGSAGYAREELVAEMTAAMLCGHSGMSNEYGTTVYEEQVGQSAAYIASWLKALKNDKSLVVQAAAKAQRAVDFILGTTWED